MRINVLLNWADGNTWLGLLLFFVGLGLLVTIHELGHFIAAKSFKVYCSDFSIGFGPKIVKIKRKKGETKFSIGIVPLGGYVSMYADVGDELPDGVSIPKSRSVAGIARWKRYIIFGAGIVMNFVLAYLIFFIACSCFPHYQTYSNVVDFDTTPYTDNQSKLLLFDEEGNEINDLSILDVDNKLKNNLDEFYTIQLRTIRYKYNGELITFTGLVQAKDAENQGSFELKPFVLNNDGENIDYVLSFNSSNFGINNIDYTSYLNFYQAIKASDEKISEVEFYEESTEKNEFKPYAGSLDNLYLPVLGENKSAMKLPFEDMYNGKISGDKLLSLVNMKTKKIVNATLIPYFKDGKFTSFNLKFYQYEYWLKEKSFGEAGRLWVDSTTLIAKALGNLFIGRGWENVGGPVAILNATTTQLINNPFYIYLYNWAMLSVNLALFNLLPFPGLDGWQILVEIIEGCVNGIKKAKFKKKQKAVSSGGTDFISTSEGSEVNATKEEATISVGETATSTYTEWKIPAKVKGIVSYVGLGLLFLLAIVIFVFDIIKMF